MKRLAWENKWAVKLKNMLNKSSDYNQPEWFTITMNPIYLA